MKSKLLPILLVLLIFLNAVLIFMLLTKPHEKPQHRQEGNFLIERLQFNDDQKEQFRELDKTHREFMMNFENQIRKNKDVLFNSFSKENFNSDSIISTISVLQAKKDTELYRFFSKVRKICTKKQVKVFDDIINEALKGSERPPVNERGPRLRNEGMPPPPR
ncbi:hypothetical protein MC378_01535 [Polaribacter sp. MSW13]|uniref:Periplasmic heavy metal sensor n=1 Tax=Polaribacter marinus TaxID=2916838 RepID=A0A9X1VJT0_9FLAO|nr:hypothetical protein [Polaribacter marinus]MCI2227829.1 hypothetical protein [Polaribacter marinus]